MSLLIYDTFKDRITVLYKHKYAEALFANNSHRICKMAASVFVFFWSGLDFKSQQLNVWYRYFADMW